MATTTVDVAARPKTRRPAELNVLFGLVAIALLFEVLGRVLMGQSFLFNMQRLQIIVLQVSIVGIVAIGVTQVIISGGIDVSSGSVVGATAMIAMSFAQAGLVDGAPNPSPVFESAAFLGLPAIVPIAIGLLAGLAAGLFNGAIIAYANVPPFIATLAMMVGARGVAKWWTQGQPVSFPTESYAAIGAGLNPVWVFLIVALIFHLALRYTVYGTRTYAVGSNEDAARISGIKVNRHKVMVYGIAGLLSGVAAIMLTSKNLTAMAGMGQMYELDAIAMAVIGGVSLSGGRGSIIGSVLGALIFGVIISGFTFLRIDAYYQEMMKAAIILMAVVADMMRQRRRASRG